MIIKVCGMRESDNIKEIEALGVDWIGLIFYPKSPRFVSAMPSYLPTRAKRVGVFVDAEATDIVSTQALYNLDVIQLHGNESPNYCRAIKSALPQTKIVKAFAIKDAISITQTISYDGLADAYLFDSFTPLKGGGGQCFNHTLLANYTGTTPFLLSGGLSIDNAEQILAIKHPMLAGYDLNSKYETSPAHKDPQKVGQFISLVRNKK